MQNRYLVIDLIFKSYMFWLTGSMPKPELLKYFTINLETLFINKNM